MPDEIRRAHREVVGALLTDKGGPASRWRRWFGRSIAAVVVVGLGAWLGTQLWPHWMKSRNEQLSEVAPPVPQAAIPARRDESASLLGTDSSLSETPLQFVLVATSLGRTVDESTASLGVDPRNPQTYSVGSRLANGLVIGEIRADHIVLLDDGRKVTVRVSEKTEPARFKLAGTSRETYEPVAQSRESLSVFIRSELVVENERVAGFRILPGTAPQALARLGLESGDIVRSIDGRPVVDQGSWQLIDESLSKGRSIVVSLERGGALSAVQLDGARLRSDPTHVVSPIG